MLEVKIERNMDTSLSPTVQPSYDLACALIKRYDGTIKSA